MVFEKKIIVKPWTIDLSKTNLKDIISLCTPEEQFVLTEKYGLISNKPTPMQQIWQKFNMSRERIRQILNKSLNKVRRLISHDKNLENIIKLAHQITKENWYIISEKELINTLLNKIEWNFSYNELLLILTSDYDLYYLHRNKRFDKIFFIEPLFEDLINDIHDTAYEILETEKTLFTQELIDKLKSLFINKFNRNLSIKEVLENDKVYQNIFNYSRHIYQFDWKIWLEDNPIVNPKTIKLKIFYILDKEGKPLHYSEIFKRIKEVFNLSKIKETTVHNELVKNKEFINVGMWTYGLTKWWYKGTNTLETIKNILKKAWRPMKISEITKEVLKERNIREITVLMTLQKNPQVFKRVSKWVYTLNKD